MLSCRRLLGGVLLWILVANGALGAVASPGLAAAVRARFAPTRVWMVGERHRVPAGHRLFLTLVRDALVVGERLLVGLEIPADLQPELDEVLSGRADPAALAPAVIDCPSYRTLLTRLGELRTAHPDRLAVRAIDAPRGAAIDRDRYMARSLSCAAPGWDRVLALVGNLHALKVAPPRTGAAARKRLAERLEDGGLPVVSVLQLGGESLATGGAGSMLRPEEPAAATGLLALAEALGVAPGRAEGWLGRAADAVVVRR